ENLEISGRIAATKFSSRASASTDELTVLITGALGFVLSRNSSVATVAPMPGCVASPSCSTPQRPSRITSGSTIAMGQDRNVEQKIEIVITRIDIIQRIERLLSRFRLKLSVDAMTD